MLAFFAQSNISTHSCNPALGACARVQMFAFRYSLSFLHAHIPRQRVNKKLWLIIFRKTVFFAAFHAKLFHLALAGYTNLNTNTPEPKQAFN
jgi:hypothetical protein